MDIKNRYYKHSRLSEQKFTHLIDCFARDLSATQAAAETGISLRATNTIYLKLRHRIAEGAEERTADAAGLVTWAPSEVFAVRAEGEGVRANVMPRLSKLWLRSMTSQPGDARRNLENDPNRPWDVLVDFGFQYCLRLGSALGSYGEASMTPSMVDEFLTFAKRRLHKFNGVAAHTFHLHLQESAYRYNARTQNVAELLLRELAQRPLECAAARGLSAEQLGQVERLAA